MRTNGSDAEKRQGIHTTTIRLWSDLLAAEHIGPRDDFFKLGGDSLKATELMRHIQRQLQINVDPLDVFDVPVLEDFVALLVSMIAASEKQCCAGLKASADGPSMRHDTQSEANEAHGPTGLEKCNTDELQFPGGKRSRKPLPALIRQVRPALIPLSCSQQAWCNTAPIHMLEQRVPLIRRLSGRLNIAQMERAIYRLKVSHEILRTRYSMCGEALCQQITQPETDRLIVEDLSSLLPAMRERRVWETLHGLNRNQLRMEEPVLDLRVFRMGNDDHYLAGFISHMAFDAASADTFWRELFGHYRGENSDVNVDDPTSRMQFADFALWERALLSDEQLSVSSSFWNRRLRAALPVSLPHAPNPMERPSPWGVIPVGFGATQFAAAARFARSAGVTIPILLLGALAAVLARWTNQDRSVFGSVINGRPPGLADAIGCFIQMRPFYIDLSADPTFADLMRLSRAAYIDANALRMPPPRDLLERLQVARFMVNITSDNNHRQDSPQEGADFVVTRRTLPIPLKTEVSHDISLSLSYDSKFLDGWLVYAADRFELGEIKGLVQALMSFIEKGIQTPHSRISLL